MAPKILNRVRETTATTGTGTWDLAGAVTTFNAFADEAATGEEVIYLAVDDPASPTKIEYGIGTLTVGSPNTLSRDTVLGGTNGTSKVSFTGTTTVICDLPKEILPLGDAFQYADAGGVADTYTVALPIAPPAYYKGMKVRCKIGAGDTNTGPSTLNVNGLGAVAIKLLDGASDPAAGEILETRVHSFVHDGTAWRLLDSVFQDRAAPVEAKTAGFTVGTSDRGKLFTCANASTLTAGLTAAATLGDSFYFMARNSGAGSLKLDPNGAETIDGVSSITFSPGQGALVVCSGAGFFTVGRGIAAGSQAEVAGASAAAVAVTPANIRYSPFTAVAWAHVAANGTILKGQGVTSIDHVTGRYQVTLAGTMADTNYVVIATCDTGGAGTPLIVGENPGGLTRSTTQFELSITGESALADAIFSFAVFGELA